MQLDLFQIEETKEFKIIDKKSRLYVEALFMDYRLGFYIDKSFIKSQEDLIFQIKKIYKIPHNNIELYY